MMDGPDYTNTGIAVTVLLAIGLALRAIGRWGASVLVPKYFELEEKKRLAQEKRDQQFIDTLKNLSDTFKEEMDASRERDEIRYSKIEAQNTHTAGLIAQLFQMLQQQVHEFTNPSDTTTVMRQIDVKEENKNA